MKKTYFRYSAPFHFGDIPDSEEITKLGIGQTSAHREVTAPDRVPRSTNTICGCTRLR